MHKSIDFSVQDIEELRANFKTFLETVHPELTHHNIICSEAFYPYRIDIGMPFSEIFQDNSSIGHCRELLEIHFTNKNRKNPRSDSYTYCRAIKLLKEFLWFEDNEKETPMILTKSITPNTIEPAELLDGFPVIHL